MKVIDLVDNQYLKIDKEDSVSHLIGEFQNSNQKAALVFDKKRFIGVTSKDMLLKSRLNLSKLKAEKIIKKVPVLIGDEDVKEAARLIYTSNSAILPVIKKKVLIGVISSIKLCTKLKEDKELCERKIEEFMVKETVTIEEDDGIDKAIELMRKNNISRLPVVDKRGNVLNIISVSDIIELYTLRLGDSENHSNTYSGKAPRQTRAYKNKNFHLANYAVNNITFHTLITAKPDDSLCKVIDLMNNNAISSMVIVDNKKVLGIITSRDLIKLFLREYISV